MGGLEISRRQDTTFDNPITTSKWVRDSRSIKSALAPHRIGSWTNSPVPTLLVHPQVLKLRDCMPLIVFIRNRLKYALNARETKAIVMQRLIKVDGKVRTDATYPAGFMDVISIEKTGEHFRLVYDTKGRFTVHRIQAEEAEYKLGKVKRVQLGKGGIPFLVTHDARTIRYPDPA